MLYIFHIYLLLMISFCNYKNLSHLRFVFATFCIFVFILMISHSHADDLPSPTAFSNTLEVGDIKQAEQWLNAGLSVNFEGSRIGQGIHIAAWEGNLEMLQFFLAKGANINVLNRHGETPLALAVWKNQQNIIDFLINNGANINSPQNHWSPLHYAAFNGNDALIDKLLQNGANINALSPNGSSPLMMAVYEGKINSVQKLLANGANTEIRNDWGDRALEWAMRKDRSDLAKLTAKSDSEFQTAMSRPKNFWKPLQQSLKTSPQLESLLAMRESFVAQNKDIKLLDEQIASERKRLLDQEFNKAVPFRATELSISADKNKPHQQQIQLQNQNIPRNSSGRIMEAPKRTRNSNKPLSMPPKANVRYY